MFPWLLSLGVTADGPLVQVGRTRSPHLPLGVADNRCHPTLNGERTKLFVIPAFKILKHQGRVKKQEEV